jgi:hypothetical protein
MSRRVSWVGFAVAAILVWAPQRALAQDTGHQHGDAAADHAHGADAPAPAHDHAGPIVPCTTLAAPPWTGLPEVDRGRIDFVREAVAGLRTPEAAIAAGFRPALGEIPGMGVHYVHVERGQNGVRVDEPDHLLFSTVDGEETLVGAAFAFIDVPDTTEPIPFDSDLAHWHDHPQFAEPGQTLHMLHIWFVPSSNGPFAGLNFWLPFQSRDVTPPSACWLGDTEVYDRVQRVSFALARPNLQLERAVAGDQAAAAVIDEPSAARRAILAELDGAARSENKAAWVQAADRFLADLSPRERLRSQMMLQVLMNAQMSSQQREAIGVN